MLPTLYEFYSSGGIVSGLSERLDSFTLNNKPITILSGSMHYFRVPPEYWRDRLRKIRAVGLNTVATYIPWNLHEPHDGIFDFGNQNDAPHTFRDVEQFLKVAQQEDLLVIARIGPYICSEMDFGGMPSWLLRNSNVRVRSSEDIFLYYLKRFFIALMSILTTLQFSKGGPIIGFQVENEYLQFAQKEIDYEYLNSLISILLDLRVTEMIFLAEDPSTGNLFFNTNKVLYGANFGENVKKKLAILKSYLQGRPSIIMEYWAGWYDVWLRNRSKSGNNTQLERDLEDIFKSRSSLNFYMFVGGTTFGFLNGATRGDPNYNYISPITNSYDFAAPINEAGDYTRKYFSIKQILQKYSEGNTRNPEMPALKQRIAYKSIPIIGEIKLFQILEEQKPFHFTNVIPMEYLPINNNSGQSYGYIIYRKNNIYIPDQSLLRIHGSVRDLAMILINGNLISKPFISQVDIYNSGYWEAEMSSFTLEKSYLNATVDIVVANLGRASYGNAETFRNQNKGLHGQFVTLNHLPLLDWKIIPLEFRRSWCSNLSGWKKPTFSKGPALYKAVLTLNETADTFIDMSSWHMGIVVVNGFVLSRYLRLGPTQTAFLPAPFLKSGDNDIVIFEHFTPYKFVTFLGEQKRNRHEPFDVPARSKSLALNSSVYSIWSSFVAIVISLTLNKN